MSKELILSQAVFDELKSLVDAVVDVENEYQRLKKQFAEADEKRDEVHSKAVEIFKKNPDLPRRIETWSGVVDFNELGSHGRPLLIDSGVSLGLLDPSRKADAQEG